MTKAVEVVEKDGEASALGRKAYGAASKALRDAHREEFDGLLDAAYADLGLVSPRVKREQRAVAEAAEKAAREVRREEMRLKKIADLEMQLEALKGGVPIRLLDDPVVADNEPEF